MRQNLRILLLAFAETQTRIDHNPRLIHTGVAGPAHRRIQLFRDRPHRILHGRKLGPCLRLAAHVIENQPGIPVGRNFRQPRVKGKAAGVIENLHPILQSSLGNLSFIGIERNRRAQIAAQPFQNGNKPLPFFVGGNSLRTRSGGFSSNIDDVCACFFQFEGAGVGAIGFVEASAVGERVGRQIDHTHDQGAFAQLHFGLAELPIVYFSIHYVTLKCPMPIRH